MTCLLETLFSETMESTKKLELFHHLLDGSHDMIFIVRLDTGEIEYVNQMVPQTLGYSFEELKALGVEAIRRPFNPEETFVHHLEELKSKEKMTDYAMLRTKTGNEFPIEANVRLVRFEGIDYNIAIVRDITARMETEQKLEELNKNLEAAVEAKTLELRKNINILEGYKQAMDAGNIVSKSDPSGRITYVNDSFCRVSGYTREEVIGKSHNIVRHPETDESVFKQMWETITAKKMWQGLIKNRKKEGGFYWIDVNIVPILDETGEISEYIAVRHDVTEIIEQRKRFETMTVTDSLTELGNRHKLLRDIHSLPSPALALFNIDNFREINDFYGHQAGDQLIVEVAGAIASLIRSPGTKRLYRLNADEFALLGSGLPTEAFIAKAHEIVDEIADRTFLLQGEEVSVQVKASLSFEKEPSNLLSSADMAMKQAKKNRLSFLVYDDSLNLEGEYANNIKWTRKLHDAIRNDRLVPYFQPIIDNKTGEREKYESLVRLIDEEGKVISPFYFLEIAKRTRHYETLTKTVIAKSFERFQHHPADFAINLTIKDISDTETRNYLFETLERYAIGERVVFEIVESEGIENYDLVIEFIKRVKGYGCKIAIDDFGSGYSNFDYLLRLQADYIKIDGSLIKNLKNDESARIMVATIVSFARQLNILTVAEFVSDEETYALVKELGIDFSQGYFLGEPAPDPH